jgi:hypothetical protein
MQPESYDYEAFWLHHRLPTFSCLKKEQCLQGSIHCIVNKNVTEMKNQFPLISNHGIFFLFLRVRSRLRLQLQVQRMA